MFAAVAVAWATPAAAEWRRAESANFIVYSEAPEPRLRSQVALLEDYEGFLRLLTGVKDPPPPNKLQVYMLRGRGQLKTVHPAVGPNVAGFYTATPFGIAAFANERADGTTSGEDEILLHEIAHHFMLQHRPMAYPAWFVEGFAEYVMTAKFKKDVIEFGLPSEMRAGWLRNARWLPVEDVLFEPVPRDAQTAALYYAQSWLLAHYFLRDTARTQKLLTYFSKMRQGLEPRKAFAEGTGMTPRQLETEIDRYTRKLTYSTLNRRSAAAAPQIAVSLLPASANDLLLLRASMQVMPPANPAAFLQTVRTAAAKHGDSFASRVLAQAEAQFGDGAKADALLTGLRAASPKDAELHYLQGMRHMAAAENDKEGAGKQMALAKAAFARAHKADENHYQSLVRYAQSLSATAGFDSENTMNILLLAHQLAPQVAEIRMNAANLLVRQGHGRDAEGLLEPIAFDPHNPDLAAAAQRLLAEARGRGKAEAPGDVLKAPAQE